MRILPPLCSAARLLRGFLRDERGMIVSAELMIIMTVGVLALVTGVSVVTSALNFEFTDIANALTGLNQSYYVTGQYAGTRGGAVGGYGGGLGGGFGGGFGGGYHGFNRGMGFNDRGNVFYARGAEASVAGSFYQQSQGHLETHAVGANLAAGQQAFALVEESALVVDEAVQAETAVTEEAQLERRLAELEAEAACLEQAPEAEACPLDELRELECRIRTLRGRLERRDVFDCDAPQTPSLQEAP